MTAPQHPAASPWLRSYRPAGAPLARLVCFPHAGGGASFFRRWVPEAPPQLELLAVQYPGREERLREPVATDLVAMAREVAAALAGDDVPLALLGHSLGAAVAYEVARALEGAGRPVALLAVSGRQAPHDPSRLVHTMSDDDLWAEIGAVGGTSPEVLENEELRALFLPMLRGDYRLSETYEPAPGPPLACPVLACSGEDDDDVDPEVLATWGELTTGPFDVRLYPGGHFYLTEARRELVAEVLRLLAEHAAVPAGWPSMP